MMPVIRVSDEVVNILKKYAIPLEDNHNSVLLRILNEYDALKNVGFTSDKYTSKTLDQNPSRITSHGKFPREREAEWIVEALTKLGGSASVSDIIRQIEKTHANDFTGEEMKTIPSGEIRWVKNVNWARYDMVQAGLLSPNAPRGIWQLTDKGKTYYSN